MSRDVTPDNPTPVLHCQGALACGWARHRFVRSERTGYGSAKQMFACAGCGHERTFGMVDVGGSTVGLVS